MANYIETNDAEERKYHAGPFPIDVNSAWQYEPRYMGLYGRRRIERIAMWHGDPWGCQELPKGD